MHRYKAIAAASILASLAGCSAAVHHPGPSVPSRAAAAGTAGACHVVTNLYELAVTTSAAASAAAQSGFSGNGVSAEQAVYAPGAVSGALADAALLTTGNPGLQTALNNASEQPWALDNGPTPADLAPLMAMCS